MPTVLLVRHGRTAANASGVLAGRSPGVELDDTGREQARRLGDLLADLPIRRVVSSPLERTRQTAEALVTGSRSTPVPDLVSDDRLLECDYGDWTNRKIADLVKEPLWRVVQGHPSAAVFPAGEGLAGVQSRAVAAIRAHDELIAEEFGPQAIWVAVSHGDVIKAVLADALGMHLDGFQRIVVDPCSVSVVRYTDLRPFVVVSNGSGDGLAGLAVADDGRAAGADAVSSDAAVGGGAGR